jgi:hypothetical protein
MTFVRLELHSITIVMIRIILLKCPVSIAQLVATRDNLCMDWSSNPGFLTSPHIMCVNLATSLHDQKKKSYY